MLQSRMYRDRVLVLCCLLSVGCSQQTADTFDKREVDTASNVTAEEGQDVLMWCPGDTENGRVRWWRNVDSGDSDRLVLNDAVLPGYEHRMSFDSTTGTITIHQAQMDDSGIYWCSVGFESFQVHLIVSERQSITSDVITSEVAGATHRGDETGESVQYWWISVFIVITCILVIVFVIFTAAVKYRLRILTWIRNRAICNMNLYTSLNDRSQGILTEDDIFHAPAAITAEESFRLQLVVPEGIEVRGVAYLDGRIYILQAASQSIHVFERVDQYWQRAGEIKSTRFERPQDIAACSLRKVLYVLDQSRIWKVDTNGNVSVYVQLSQFSATLSVTKKHLLVISSDVIRKYTPGIVTPSMSQFRLPVGLSGTKPWHAVEADDGYVIAHTETARFHRVSKLRERTHDKSKVEVFVYGREVGEGKDQLSSPVYLALEPKNGHIFVADHDNSRVVLLDHDLRRVTTITDLPEGCYPTRLCYVDERKELLVGMSNGSVIGYKFKRQAAAGPSSPLL